VEGGGRRLGSCGRTGNRGHGSASGPGPGLGGAPPLPWSTGRQASLHPGMKTSWGMCAAVETGLCAGCGICVDVCPQQAISMEGAAVIAPDFCTGCGACVPECPRGALSLVPQAVSPQRGRVE